MFSHIFDEYSNDNSSFYLGGLNDELLEEYYKNIENEEDNKYYDTLLYDYDNYYYYDDYDDYDDY
jgi:hypothetical protein|tara:strand:- start:877 stop:1071 length:195 start_codon:yes stop_codon:yes gene_type:complete